MTAPAEDSEGTIQSFFLYLKLSLTAVFWGGTYVAGRVIMQQMGPFSASFLRFVVASGFLIIFVLKSHGHILLLKRGQILPVVLLGLTGVFAFNFFLFSGLKTVTASRAALINSINPVFITILSSFFFHERLYAWKIFGIFISVTGAVFVVSHGSPWQILQGNIGRGELFILGSMASWASYSLIGKAAMEESSPLVTVTYACVIGTACLFLPAYLEGISRDFCRYSWLAWLIVLYVGFLGSAVGFIWYYEGIRAVGPSRAAVFINLVPVSAMALASVILKESLSRSSILGAILVISGVYLTNRAIPDLGRR